MIRESEFHLLRVLQEQKSPLSQRQLAQRTGLSLGSVNRLLGLFRDRGWAAEDGSLTDSGREALAPYRVSNAVIMAAGISSGFAPLSYEKPKGLLRVRGERLIERQIRQLQEAGVREILVVVGYMAEKYFYLAERFGVELIVNGDFRRYHNPSTLMQVLDRLDNSYICSCDDYFSENPFESYVYDSYYACVSAGERTQEYCVQTDEHDRITRVTVGGEAGSWYMLGHAYFSRNFSRRFAQLLRRDYEERPQMRLKLWEDFLAEHLKELPIRIRRYGAGTIWEFDTLDELRAFDEQYMHNAESPIFEHIAGALYCDEEAIGGIEPLRAGQVNSSFLFEAGGRRYVYRMPRSSDFGHICRESEYASEKEACRLGLDRTFVAMDPASGWKISAYAEHTRALDYRNAGEVEAAMKALRRLHSEGRDTGFALDVRRQLENAQRQLKTSYRDSFTGSEELGAMILKLCELSDRDGQTRCLCHGNCYADNFLVGPDLSLDLIDWEYSGMADPGWDYGTFLCCGEYTPEEALPVLEQYYGRVLSPEELRHAWAYAAIMAYFWFLWSLELDSRNETVGSWPYTWYRCARTYGKKALSLYDAELPHQERERNY